MSLQIEIADYERTIFSMSFPPIYGAQNRPSERSRMWFSFLGPFSLRVGARIWVKFRSHRIGIVLYGQNFISDKWFWNREGTLERYRLVEKALTLVLSRSLRCHMISIVYWSEQKLRLLVVSANGNVPQGPLRVDGLHEEPLLWSARQQFILDRIVIIRKAPGSNVLG